MLELEARLDLSKLIDEKIDESCISGNIDVCIVEKLLIEDLKTTINKKLCNTKSIIKNQLKRLIKKYIKS